MKSFQQFLAVLILALAVLLPGAGGQTVDTPPGPTPAIRVETTPVAGGAEIITIFANTRSFTNAPEAPSGEIPVFSILRDTLGDNKTENDRLRYVWLMTYAEPTLMQKATGFVPFLYTRTTNKVKIGGKPPPALADMQRSSKAMWSQVLWTVFRKVVLGEFGVAGTSTVAHYRQNVQDYRRTAISSALTLLSLYESTEGERVLSETELKDIQARLWLNDKPFGWHMQDEHLHRFYDKQISNERDLRGHNWELLRQYAESQGLYFDPLEMPDGSARHAIVWVDEADLEKNKGRQFERRFLNIKDPWSDQKLRNWKGYKETVWYDADSRIVPAKTAGAAPRTMIPLALYGLDHPKVPVILIDFRDAGNPHRREMTKRVLSDVTGNVLSLSRFSSLPYLIGRFTYEFVTGRRGIDINQPSRMRSYAQLKLLLALDQSLDQELRGQMADRIERVSMNPLENDLNVEIELARTQYNNLISYATRPDGLPAKLDRDRREEMVRLAHSRKEQALFKVAHYLTLGLYTHREDKTPELVAKMDVRRQLDHHERVLREIASRSSNPEIDSNLAQLKRSLQFVAENGTEAMDKTAKALGKIFGVSQDEGLRSLCLAGLYKIDNSTAKSQLLAIYDNRSLPDNWRVMSARYLRQALDEGQRISKHDAVTIAGIDLD